MEDNKMSKRKIKLTGIAAAIGIMVATGAVSTVHIATDTPNVQTSYKAVTEQKSYTVLVYMAGSTLEYEDINEIPGAATKDLNEMISAMTQNNVQGINENMNLVIEVGGSKGWEKEELKEVSNARFCIDASGINRKEEISKRSMGVSETLSDFINYGVLSYPAEQYILLFWNHGNGAIKGFGCDTLYNDDSLELDELNKGIEGSVMNQKKFSIVGFDACFMGNIETASILSDNSEYLLASAELEPQDGWNYDWLSVFRNEVALVDIGNKVVSEYDEDNSKYEFPYSLAFIDLSRVESIIYALNTNIEPLLKESQNSYKMLGSARMNFVGYGIENDPSAVCIPNLVDLRDVLEYFKVDNDRELLDKLVISHCDSFVDKDNPLSGLNIYIPSGTDNFLEDDLKEYVSNQFATDYVEYVKQYTKFLLAYDDKRWQDLISKFDASSNILQVSLPISDIDSLTGAYLAVYGTLDSEAYRYLLTADSDVKIHNNGKIEAILDTEYAALKDEVLCLIELSNNEECTQYQSPILYNGEFCKMTIQYDITAYDGEIVSIVPVNEQEQSQKKVYSMKAGDDIQPLYPLIQMEGENAGEKLSENKVYSCGEDDYYIGNHVILETDNDAYISTIKKQVNDYQYGFLLIDNKQQYTYTDIIIQN